MALTAAPMAGGRTPSVVSDELWAVVDPLLPRRPRRYRPPGRQRLDVLEQWLDAGAMLAR